MAKVTFATKEIHPATPIYVTGEDYLNFRVWNSAPNVVVSLGIRFLNTEGELLSWYEEMTPTTDRATNSLFIPLTEGWLIGLNPGHTVGPIRRGQCFCMVDLRRGTVGGVDILTLASGYIYTLSREANFPAGITRGSTEGIGCLRTVVGTDPAAGHEICETVPTNTRWRLVAMQLRLVTDATIADRRIRVVLDDGSTEFTVISAGATQSANWARRYNFAPGFPLDTAFIHDQLHCPLPHDLYLYEGYRIRTVTAGRQPGDDYSAPVMLVEEWLEI